MQKLRSADGDIRSLKSSILLGIRNIAAYAHRAAALGHREEAVHKFLYKALFAIGRDDWGKEELQPIVRELDEVNRLCIAMPDNATPKAIL